MTDFTHSIVLFSGDDGLPLEFNVRNTNEKTVLRDMIEHGGGMCTLSDNAVHLISPGTKVLNAILGKKLVSSRYIFDCVSKNYLLDVDDYVYVISEAEMSDISDEESERLIGKKGPVVLNENKTSLKDDANTDDKADFNISETSTPSKLSSMQQKSSTTSNLSESFVEGSQDVSLNPRIAAGVDIQACECVPLTSTAKEPDSMDFNNHYEDIEKDLSPIQASASLVSPLKRNVPQYQHDSLINLSGSSDSSISSEQNQPNVTTPEKRNPTFPHYEGHIEESEDEELFVPVVVPQSPGGASPVQTAVSSSQPELGGLDQFDNLLLNKAQQKAQPEDEDGLSQSYTVSSSADAQKPSAEVNSAEVFDADPSTQLPDSPNESEVHASQGQLNTHQLYIQELEAEVKKILEKPSPKSTEDKIYLVKYICCVKKLSPAHVINSLHQL